MRDNPTSITIEAELSRASGRRMFPRHASANGVLTIKGEKKLNKEEKTENYYLAERSYGAFWSAHFCCPTASMRPKSKPSSTRAFSRSRRPQRPRGCEGTQRKIEINKAS